MWRTVVFCLLIAVFLAEAADQASESRLVQITQRPVRGYKNPESGVYFFQGIPYASVPTGRNRYKAPLPPPTWMYPLEAVNGFIACPQASSYPGFFDHFKQQEDCLVASVYVPDTQEKKLPVAVYVHGGAYQIGAGNKRLPDKLVAQNNVIAVTFNYRLGSHGFLCLGTEDVPGNAGMKDQVAALKWVQKNIASFGGNPDDVTIIGYSAGSAAVDLLMLSKSAEGLFNKVIPESGGSIGSWGIQSDPTENAKQFAKDLNFTGVDNIYALEEFYKTVSFDLLTSLTFKDKMDSVFGPAPCVERPNGEDVFLDKSPVDILKSGDYRKIPLLYGFSNMEGLIRINSFDLMKSKMNENFSEFLPADLKFESTKQKVKVAELVKQFYFEEKPVGDDTILSYIDFFTDVIIAYPMLRTVKYHVDAGHNQIYLYDYSYVDENVPNVPHTEIKGAGHCSQTAAIFGSGAFGIPDKPTEEFLKMSNIMRSIWGNFIKTGKPIPEGSSLPAWPAVGAGWSPHMSLGNEISLRGPLLERRMRFWDDIYSQYYRDPVPPQKPAGRRLVL